MYQKYQKYPKIIQKLSNNYLENIQKSSINYQKKFLKAIK